MARTRLVLAGAMALAVVAAGCGGEGAGGGGGGGGAAASARPRTVTVEAGDERVAHPLAAGRYRLSWTAPACDSVSISITQQNGQFTFTRNNPPLQVFNVEAVPDGEFFIEQTDAGCTEWTIRLDRT